MAARKNPKNPPQSYELQRAKQLLNRLNSCALGKVEMTGNQIKAATVVINKEIPDLARLEHTGKDGSPLTVEIVRFGSDQAPV